MHLVDGHRGVVGVVDLPDLHPVCIAPVVGEIPHPGGGLGGNLGVGGERIRLVDPVHVEAGPDMELVRLPLRDTRDETLPDPRSSFRLQRVLAGVVEVEIPDHRHVLGIRRPDREIGPGNPIYFDEVAAQLLVETEMRAFVEEKQIVLGEQAEVGQVRSNLRCSFRSWFRDRVLGNRFAR